MNEVSLLLALIAYPSLAYRPMRVTSKNRCGQRPYRRLILTNFCNSRISPVLHLGIWFNP